MNLIEQIDWLSAELRYMKRVQPFKIAAGRLTPERATKNIESAMAVLNTLNNLRALLRGDGVPNA